jgi:mono/diheme cytochrome c family protein
MMSMRTWFPAACIGLTAFTLLGCGEVDPPYSALVKYALRTDPLVLKDKDDLGNERYDPDRPGQLPLMSLKDLFDPLHPLFAKRVSWAKDGLLRDPMAASDSDRSAVAEYLEQIFGTPANPSIGQISDELRDALKVDVRSLERGSMIYRVQCLHCHGVNGDGRGPTARWINPHPRDYRQGLFKFQSVDQTDAPRPPRRADLQRVIKYGVEGTAMPSFVLLPDADIDLLVSYVIHLSIRGKVEYEMFKGGFELDEQTGKLQADPDRPPQEFLPKMTQIVANDWMDSQGREIKIAPYRYQEGDDDAMSKSVKHGQELFLGIGEEGKTANCVSCHADYGRQSKFRFDSWGTLVRPNNLTQGQYRGGRRTIDLYYRIHSGINGSGMASFGKQLKSDSLWDLVNFVQTLPYPAMRQKRGINID